MAYTMELQWNLGTRLVMDCGMESAVALKGTGLYSSATEIATISQIIICIHIMACMSNFIVTSQLNSQFAFSQRGSIIVRWSILFLEEMTLVGFND